MEEPKILIVDDDPDIVEALKMTLEASHYKVYTAANGTEGLKQVKAVNPNLIILDVMMDTTTAGFQVSLALRKAEPSSEYAAYRHIPILMITAIHTTTPLRFGPDKDYLPVDAFIEKPIEPEVLLKQVREHLVKQTV